MADPNPAAPSSTAEADKPAGVTYTISTQYIKDLSFENPRAPHVYVATAGKTPHVHVSVAVSGSQIGEKLYEVVLQLKAEAKHEDEIVFMAELAYGGVVVSSGAVPMEHLTTLIMIEVPRQLFPFARAILANATRDGGFVPLLLAPVNFEELQRQKNVEIDVEVSKLAGGAV